MQLLLEVNHLVPSTMQVHMDLGMLIHPAMLEAISHTCRDTADSKVGISTDVLTLLAFVDWFTYGARVDVLLLCISLLTFSELTGCHERKVPG